VDTVSQAIDVGGKAAEQVAAVLKALGEAVKPALPVLKSASDEALKLAAPVVSAASKQATEALQGAGVDPAPVLSVAKVHWCAGASRTVLSCPVLFGLTSLLLCSLDRSGAEHEGDRRREARGLGGRGDHHVAGPRGLRRGRRSGVSRVPPRAAGLVAGLVQPPRLQRYWWHYHLHFLSSILQLRACNISRPRIAHHAVAIIKAT
jgi:hypothetical protein